jgi:tRNA 2-(methylsulfanyl)-N6-isopentenyladenosine37 hydroxylase
VDAALKLLACATPEAWFDAACNDVPTLLIDHANCEKKAAGTAVSLLYRYVDKPKLLRRMSRLAREELRHFEQVLAMMSALGITYEHLTPSRYASSMRALIRTSEPGRLIDTLIVGAIVEARSCERFAGLASRLDGRLADFYRRLLTSEARHCEYYLELAGDSVDERMPVFVDCDRDLVLSADPQLRFHSGAPVAA